MRISPRSLSLVIKFYRQPGSERVDVQKRENKAKPHVMKEHVELEESVGMNKNR